MSEKNFFTVNRSLFDSFLWEDKPFSKGQAWVDLFGKANHADGEINIRGTWVTIKRGQSGRSELTFSKDWGWSRGKVRRFLSLLQSRGMIELKQDNKTTITTICNYERFQLEKKDSSTANSTADGTPNEHQTNTKQDTNNKKENNNNNNKNNIIKKTLKKSRQTISPVDDKQAFINQLPDSIIKVYEMNLVLSTLENLIDYCKAHNKKYSDYNAALRGFLKRDTGKTNGGKSSYQNNRSLKAIAQERFNRPNQAIDTNPEQRMLNGTS